MRRLLVLLLVLPGCSEPEKTGRSDTVRWFVWPGERMLADETVSGVEDIFGMELVESDTPVGSTTVYFDVTLDPSEETSWASGRSCTSHIFLRGEDVNIVAHELGHSYGLGHVDDPNNLMHPSVGRAAILTDEQIDKMRESAWILEESCTETTGYSP